MSTKLNFFFNGLFGKKSSKKSWKNLSKKKKKIDAKNDSLIGPTD